MKTRKPIAGIGIVMVAAASLAAHAGDRIAYGVITR